MLSPAVENFIFWEEKSYFVLGVEVQSLQYMCSVHSQVFDLQNCKYLVDHSLFAFRYYLLFNSTLCCL
jgi:hypothetical protein